MKILLIGSSGRMGKNVIECANKKNVEILAGVDVVNSNYNFATYKNFEVLPQDIIDETDLVLDFSLSQNTLNVLNFCKENNKKLVICCTGHDEDMLNEIKKASNTIPIFMTGNTSLGIYLISKFLNENKNIFNGYDINIIEKHHKNKKDAPSGTAKMMGKVFEDGDNSVKYFSIRAGNIVGEHEILLAKEYEQIIIKHIAEDRRLFANGALEICKFMSEQLKNRLYTMKDLCEKF